MNTAELISGVMAVAKARYTPQEGDYVDGGLWHCGKCRTPKQTQITVDGKILKPFCQCKCERERADRENAEFERRKREDHISRLRADCFPEKRMTEFTFSRDDGKNKSVTKTALTYVHNFPEMLSQGAGITFYGTVGTGKTFYAAAICNALIDSGIPCLFTSFPRLINILGGTYDGKQEYLDSLQKYKLIVFDDLSSERDTSYANEIVFGVINSRINSGLPFLVTTNLSASELTSAEDLSRRRIYSRLAEKTLLVELRGEDRRINSLAENRARFMQLFKEESEL